MRLVSNLRKEVVMNKKDISLAVMATVLFLEIVSKIFGGTVGIVADKVSDIIQHRVQVEMFLNEGGSDG
jgi:hypothetical protein